jgi:hypothetical protein
MMIENNSANKVSVSYLIISYLTPLLELGFPSAGFADFFAAVAHRRCHWGVCRTRPVKIEFKVH